MIFNFFKYLIIPIVLFIATLSIVFWVLLPLFNDLQVALDLKKQSENNLDDRLKLAANLKHLISQYNERINNIDSFNQTITEGQKIPELLVNLEALASENGLVFTSVDFKPKSLKTINVKTLIMEIKVKGSYPAFKNYLRAIEKNLRIFDVVSVSFIGIAPGQTSTKIDNFEFNLKVNTYYY